MAGEKLGEIRRKLLERYTKVAEPVAHYTPADLIQDKLQRTIWGFLNEFGVDYPIDAARVACYWSGSSASA